jgi:hypothetical protein
LQEQGVETEGNKKRPDYTFCYPANKPLFHLEAKRPKVDILSDVNPAFQIRSYGWSSKLPISILTNFKDLAIYNTLTEKIQARQQADQGRKDIFNYTEYIERFDEI